MGTLIDYYDADHRRYVDVQIPSISLLTYPTGQQSKHKFLITMNAAFIPGIKYFTCYAEEDMPINELMAYLTQPGIIQGTLIGYDKKITDISYTVDMAPKMNGVIESISLNSLCLGRHIYLYYNRIVSNDEMRYLVDGCKAKGLYLFVRDRNYAMNKSMQEKPLAFVSHDSRDKESLVKQLVSELSARNCPVWYDEYSLKVGDSLREMIEKGLKEAKKCIIIISNNFIKNNGWCKTEFNAIFTRELVMEQRVILPVWHDVDKVDVFNYSPVLTDRLALNSNIGVKLLAAKLSQAILKDA